MIPILYDSSEIAFTNNGLGRLRDCISCVVTEERNGIYECDFEYPMNGVNFDKIQLGRIIAVKHDDTNDIQPFDIVSCSKPINGIVTFHANHVSYRQSKLTVAGTNINSLADAFTLLGTATPSNPFTYETDMVKTGYLSAANGIPRSVRQMLGGVEGSILDAYGGEYEWDGFLVRLLSARGVQRDLTIRYGVNMLEYNEETDYSGTYTAVVPYWTGGDSIIVGSVVDSGNTPYDGHSNAIPLDLTDKFENEPTTSELEAAAASYMLSNQTHLPKNSIEIQFVQLQDSNEYAQFAPLLKCELCDWVNVIFPDYKTTGRFKIVKTAYNVLLERYDSLELGTLSTTLSEALGIESSLNSNGSGGSSGEGVDYIIETNTSNGWLYRKWNSGVAECWATKTITAATNSSDAGGYVSASAATPSAFPFTFTAIPNVQVTCNSGTITGSVTCAGSPSTTSAGSWKLYRNNTNAGTNDKIFMFYVVGKWK